MYERVCTLGSISPPLLITYNEPAKYLVALTYGGDSDGGCGSGGGTTFNMLQY